MSLLKIPMTSALKARRIPNAFMLFVKEQKKQIQDKCPRENKAALGSLLGKKWKSMAEEEKRVYFDKYKALKKLEVDNSDLSSVESESTVVNENILKSEMDGILTDANSATELDVDHKPSKEINKRKNDAYSTSNGNYSVKKHKRDLMSSPGGDSFEDFHLLSPEKPLKKKVRRSPNAFLIFAKEQRCHLSSSNVKDKKGHANSVLGQMWRSLSDSEKEKYYLQAKELHHLYKNSDTPLLPKPGKAPKRLMKATPKKKTVKRSVGRPSRKEKEASHFATAPDFKSIEASCSISARKIDSSAIPERTANCESTTTSSEPRVSSDFSSANYLRHHNNFISSHFQRMQQPGDYYHQSKFCYCQQMLPAHNNENGWKNCQVPDAGMSRSCYGNGLVPPLLPSYPFGSASAFYMYNQAMAHQMYAFPCSQPYPQQAQFSAFSQFNGCNPYYPLHPSAYFNSFFAGRCDGPFLNASSSSAAAASASHREESSAEGPKNDESSNDEMLIVDEGLNREQQLPGNETDANNF